MSLNYQEKISAKMTRIVDEEMNEILLVRNETKIKFGQDPKVIGKVIMTNPGSYGFHSHPEWKAFTAWSTTYTGKETIVSESNADSTLRCIIRVIREAYLQKYDEMPNGVVKVYNLSSIVQPKGSLAEDYHLRAKQIIEKNHLDISYLEDPFLKDKDKFINDCRVVDFVIMGFVKDKFKQKLDQTKKWSQELPNVITATNKDGHFTHPYTWNIHNDLHEQALNKLVNVLNMNVNLS